MFLENMETGIIWVYLLKSEFSDFCETLICLPAFLKVCVLCLLTAFTAWMEPKGLAMGCKGFSI